MSEPMFLGIPEWALDDPHWLCSNGHVSTRYLKSEARGAALCLACREPVWLVTDREELAAALAADTPLTIRPE